MLFADETVVIHISGSNDSAGKILKTNQSLVKVFGYSKNEIEGHSINVLMPSLFAKRHGEFMKNFFKTGHQILFDKEQTLYGLHRNNSCFCMKLFIKQLPNLTEGIQYVGMIRPEQADCDYILTDLKGEIFSFSSGISGMLRMSTSLFDKEENRINIQIIAPELINVFFPLSKENNLLSNFQEPGGHKLTFVIPKDFSSCMQEDLKKELKDAFKGNSSKSMRRSKQPSYWAINRELNTHGMQLKQITSQQLLLSHEYKECEMTQVTKCEIADVSYGERCKAMEPLRLRVFKVMGATMKKEEYNPSSNESSRDVDSVNWDNKDFAGEMDNEYNLNALIRNLPAAPLESHKEDTQVTEKMQGNIISTENIMETIEMKEAPKTKLVADTALGQIKRVKEDLRKQSDSTDSRKWAMQYRIFSSEETKYKKPQSLVMVGRIRSEKRLPLLRICRLSDNPRTPKTKKRMHSSDEGEVTLRESLNEIRAPPVLDFADARKSINVQLDDLLESGSSQYTGKDEKQSSKADNTEKSKKQHTNAAPEQEADKRQTLSGKASRKDEPCMDMKKNTRDKLNELMNYKGAKSFDALQPNDVPELSPMNRVVEPQRAILNKSFSESVKISPILEENNEREDNVEDKKLNKQIQVPPISKVYKKTEEPKPTLFSMRTIKEIHKPKMIFDNTEPSTHCEYKQTEKELQLRQALVNYAKSKTKRELEKIHSNKVESQEDSEDDNDDNNNENEKDSDKKSNEVNIYEKEVQQQKLEVSNELVNPMNQFYSLRMAIDEKYVSNSIQVMKYVGSLVFLLLLAISIITYMMKFTLYSKINTNIKNIDYSQERVNNLVDIELRVASLIILTADYKQHAADPDLSQEDSFVFMDLDRCKNLFESHQSKVKFSALKLKDAQAKLSMKTIDFEKKSQNAINPQAVMLTYKMWNGGFMILPFTFWQSLMETVVSANKIAAMNISEVDDIKENTVFFLMENSRNSIAINLDISSTIIRTIIQDSIDENLVVSIVLLSVASFALLVSIILLIPMISKMNASKQKVFELFMFIKKRKANEEVKVCRRFLGSFQIVQETDIIQAEDGEQKENLEINTEHFNSSENTKEVISTKRKYKKLVVSHGIVILKFVILILIMEGYFLLDYLLSQTFLRQVNSLVKELNILISRFSANSLLLLTQKFAIYKDYKLKAKGKEVTKYLEDLQNQLYETEELLLNTFSENYGYHSKSYNEDFNSITFSNICKYIPEFTAEQAKCETYYQGILQKGIYSATIKAWDFLRQLNFDYLNSNRLPKDQYRFLNDAMLSTVDNFHVTYMNISLATLVKSLHNNNNYFFNKESVQNKAIFSVYIIYLVFVYIFFWNGFLLESQKELWKTKTVLSVLEPELVLGIPEIKTFIIENSSTASSFNNKN